MAINVIGGGPNIHIAKVAQSFIAAGITLTNTTIIYKILPGQGYISYVPGRGINGIIGFELNAGYMVYAKTDMDLSETLAMPYPAADMNIGALIDKDGSILIGP